MGGKFYKLTLGDVPLSGKTVLLRADYNVPLGSDGSIVDDFRIRSSLPTVKKLLSLGCKVVIISHLGRPDGKSDPKFSLEPAAQRLAELLGQPIRFVDQCIGHKVQMAVKRAPKPSVIVLENLRFHAEEEANDDGFAAALARDSGAAYFVQDGFGVVHRAHASTAAITQHLPSIAGLLLEREYMAITGAMRHPKRPLLAVVGGAKIADKIDFIAELVKVADQIVIGGAMANTFLAYKGFDMAKSKLETDENKTIDGIYKLVTEKVGAEKVDDFLQLPIDLAIGASVDPEVERQETADSQVPTDSYVLDVGNATIKRLLADVTESQTVIWNGPLGMTELPNFAVGSAALAQALADNPQITSIVGGGDTADFVLHWDPRHGDSFTHVSTGGGASLELMSGLKLPGIESLLDAKR